MRRITAIFIPAAFIFFMAVTFVGQYLLYTGEIAAVNNFDVSGSIPVSMSSVYIEKGELKLKLSDENIKILINGSQQFCRKDGELYVYEIRDGDVVHADLTDSGRYGVIYISDSGENILVPARYSKFAVNGGVVKLFTVKIAELSQKR